MALTLLLLALTAHAHSASKVVVVLGDSLSAEYGLQRGEGWVNLMQQRVDQQKIGARIINASISGETTSGGRARLKKLLDQHQPDIVIIELGGNDALRGLPLSSTHANLLNMVNSAQAANARVLLIGMQIPPNYGADYTQQFSSLFPRIAKESGAALVPFMLKGVAENTDMFQSDRIHPAAAAHPIILDNIWPALQLLLRAK